MYFFIDSTFPGNIDIFREVINKNPLWIFLKGPMLCNKISIFTFRPLQRNMIELLLLLYVNMDYTGKILLDYGLYWHNFY